MSTASSFGIKLRETEIKLKKRIFALFSAIIMVLLPTSCSKKAETVAEYTTVGEKPSFVAPLYSDKTNGEYAVLLREYGEYGSAVAVGELDGEKRVLYKTEEGSCIYELYVYEGIVAFYDMTPENDEDVYYRLKVVDTKSGEVYSPYSKLICEDGDVQPRFLALYDRDVYYVTASLKMGMSRIMKYTVGEEKPVEFVSTEMTENSFTYGHSHTFVNRHDQSLIVSRVVGYDQYIDVYNIVTGEKKSEKLLPSNVALVYNCDYDEMSGVYALYYAEISEGDFGAEAVGYTTNEMKEIKKLATLNGDSYVERESIVLVNNLILLCMKDSSLEDDPYSSFNSVAYNIADNTMNSFTGSVQIWIRDESIYNLSLDKKNGKDKMVITKHSITSK